MHVTAVLASMVSQLAHELARHQGGDAQDRLDAVALSMTDRVDQLRDAADESSR